jgi:hypothetical protein
MFFFQIWTIHFKFNYKKSHEVRGAKCKMDIKSMIQILYKHENTDGWSKEHMILPTHLTLTPSLLFLAFFLDLSLNFLHVIFFCYCRSI